MVHVFKIFMLSWDNKYCYS